MQSQLQRAQEELAAKQVRGSAGGDLVEVTVNGIGERAGNASLEEVVMALKVRGDRFGVSTGVETRHMVRASRTLCEVTETAVARNKAVVGINAFAHEAGIHQHGMLADSRTRFVGIRGLMQQKLATGETDKALKLAEKAYALKPSHGDLQNTLLSLQTREHDWKGARQTLKDKRRQGSLPQDVHLRRDAVLALQEAREVLAHGNSISAREAAISASSASAVDRVVTPASTWRSPGCTSATQCAAVITTSAAWADSPW